jgi:DNA (cytosine-5)-methyltransferase 1
VATAGAIRLVEPFVMHLTHHGADRVHSLDKPLPTITGAHRGELALVEPMIIQTDHQSASPESYVRGVDEPLATVVSKQSMILVEPMVMKYYKTGRCKSINQPLDTITTKARFMLVEPVSGETVGIDILTRMLQPHELAAAHSFPKGYRFTGNKEDQTKQIGNSVPVELACAHAEAVLR